MKRNKKNVRCRITVWVLTACLLSGTVLTGAAEEIPREEPGAETGLELVTEEAFEEYEMLSDGQDAEEEPIFLEEDDWIAADDSGNEPETDTLEEEAEPETSEGQTGEEDVKREPEAEGSEGGTEHLAEVFDVEDMGSLTAEELSLLAGPDDPAAEELALLAVREAQAAAAEASAYASPDLSGKFSEIYGRAGSYLRSAVTDPIINSIGGDWAVLGLARAGYPAGDAYYTKYAKNVSEEVTRVGGVLSDVKYTEYSRVILGLTAAGYDAGNVAGYDLVAPLSDLENVAWQGINGPIWALIALDSHDYDVRQASDGKMQATRQNLIGAILEGQLGDGGWSISGFSADPDMTAMALMALTPYYVDGGTWSVYGENVTVRQVVDQALETLSSLQDASGGYVSYNEPNSESCAQVLTALAGLGIDPEKDARFQKNGRSVLDALLSYEDGSGGFSHTPGSGVNGMSCEQAYYALAAYSRYLNGQNRLYDMTDVASLKAVPKPEDFVLDPEPETEPASEVTSGGDGSVENGDDGSDGNNKPGGTGNSGSNGNNKPGGTGNNDSGGNNKPGGSGNNGSDGNNKPGGTGNNGSDESDKPNGTGDDGSDGNSKPDETGGDSGDGTGSSGGSGNNGSGSGSTSRPGGSTHSLGNTGSGSSSKGSSSSGGGSSSGGSSAGKKVAEGMAEVELDGKRYVVDEKAASLIERIRELSSNSGFEDRGEDGGPDESEIETLVQIYREYLELSEEQQAYVLNYDVLEEMTEQAGEQNHQDSDTKIRAEGVEWYIKLEVSPVAETDVFYRELQGSIGSGMLRTLYRIGFTDLLTGEEYQPEREVALVVPADGAFLEDGSGQGQSVGTDGTGLYDSLVDEEQFLVILVSGDGLIWYPDFVSEDGAFLLKAKGFTHFGIAEALAESSLVLEDETESEAETEAVTEAETVPETAPESESETEAAVAAAGFGGPVVVLWIIMLVVGTNILVLSFLGKKGYLNFPGGE